MENFKYMVRLFMNTERTRLHLTIAKTKDVNKRV